MAVKRAVKLVVKRVLRDLSGFEWRCVALRGFGRCVEVVGCVWVCLGVVLG